MALMNLTTAGPNTESRSKARCRGAVSYGNASRSCCITPVTTAPRPLASFQGWCRALLRPEGRGAVSVPASLIRTELGQRHRTAGRTGGCRRRAAGAARLRAGPRRAVAGGTDRRRREDPARAPGDRRRSARHDPAGTTGLYNVLRPDRLRVNQPTVRPLATARCWGDNVGVDLS